MKKLLTAVAVALFAGALAVPAWASVDALVFVNVSKDVTITENIFKLKTVDIFVFFNETTEGAAEALALVNQENNDNFTQQDLDGDAGFADDSLTATIDGGSISGNAGITQVNQDVGVGANQANVVALAITNAVSSIAHAESAGDQRNNGNTALTTGPCTACFGDDPEKTATISGSVNGNDGITQVNQNAGIHVNQANLVSVALGDADGAILALSDAFLGQENTNNTADAFTTNKAGLISGSVNGNNGITSVNQATGNNINQGTAISFAGIARIGVDSGLSGL